MTAEFINDVAGQPVTPVVTANSLQAADYRNDTTPPTLRQFSFNVDDGTLTLSFSETVNVSSFDPSSVTLQNQQDRATAGQIVILTDGFQCNPTERDLKTFTDLGTSDSDTLPILMVQYSIWMGMNLLTEWNWMHCKLQPMLQTQLHQSCLTLLLISILED